MTIERKIGFVQLTYYICMMTYCKHLGLFMVSLLESLSYNSSEHYNVPTTSL
jgi:hypothetical protein